jgi:predicted MFS family arabinose efflux permease
MPSTAARRPALNERALLFILAAVQFTHIMDFMIMMPLGARLMQVFGITPAQFSLLVASYGFAAAATGFLGGFVLDRFDRRSALLTLYTGFGLATLACAFAPTYEILMGARIAAGACGGVAGSLVTSMVGDVIPPERRGRGMGVVMTAFPIASVFGVPAGLILSGWLEWHAPFQLLALCSAAILLYARRVLPHVPSHRSDNHPVRQMLEILTHRIHRRCFLLSAVLVFAGASVVPFMAPSLITNVGLDERWELPLVYLFGGACAFFTMPWLGRLADRHDKFHVLVAVSLLAVAILPFITRLGPGPLPYTLAVTTLFFIAMSGRFAPAMAMITNAVAARYRGGFMSVNSAVQQASGGLANLTAGLLITQDVSGRLVGYSRAGLVAGVAFVLTVVLAAWLRSGAPHAARNPAPATPAPAEPV